MEQFQNLTVNGVGLMVLVIGLVQVCKRVGVRGNVLILIAAVLGTALAVGYQVSLLDAQFKTAFDVIVYGLGGGLAATGYYDLINERIPKLPKPGRPTKFFNE